MPRLWRRWAYRPAQFSGPLPQMPRSWTRSAYLTSLYELQWIRQSARPDGSRKMRTVPRIRTRKGQFPSLCRLRRARTIARSETGYPVRPMPGIRTGTPQIDALPRVWGFWLGHSVTRLLTSPSRVSLTEVVFSKTQNSPNRTPFATNPISEVILPDTSR